jgi:dihydroneopterin aldolase
MTRVFLENLEFYAYHGASEEERRVGHRFRLDIEVDVTEQAKTSDLVSDTLDYGALAETALATATSASYATVERLLEEIGNQVLTRFAQAEKVHVKLAKLLPPIPATVGAAGVSGTFCRE